MRSEIIEWFSLSNGSAYLHFNMCVLNKSGLTSLDTIVSVSICVKYVNVMLFLDLKSR